MKKTISLILFVLLFFSSSSCSIAENIRIKDGVRPNVRTQPSTDGEIIGIAESGQVYEVLSISENNWYKIRYDDESTGWIAGGMVEKTSLQSASGTGSDSPDGIIKAQKIKFNENTIQLAAGYSTKAEYTITPENANEKLIWKSSDTRIATVDENGNITGIKKGSCTISIFTDNGRKQKAQATVTVDNYDMVFVSREPQIGYYYYKSGRFNITGKVKTGCVKIPEISTYMMASIMGGDGRASQSFEITPVKVGKDVITVNAGNTKTEIKVLVLPETFAPPQIQNLGFGYGAVIEKDSEGVFNGHTYRIINDSVNWDIAKKVCEEKGGHLITITSVEEQQFIEKLLSANKSLWLGLRREEMNSSVWNWVTGEEFIYSHWENGELNNYGGIEDCTVILSGYKWNDLSGTNLSQCNGYICEWDYILDEIILIGDFPQTNVTTSIDYTSDDIYATENRPLVDETVRFDEKEEIVLLEFSSVSKTESSEVIYENGVYKLKTLNTKDPGTNSNAVSFKLASAFDASSYSKFVFYIKDLHGSNTHKVTLIDGKGKIHSQWIETRSEYYQWKRIEVMLRDYGDIDLNSIMEIRIGEWNEGQYWFNRIGFLSD